MTIPRKPRTEQTANAFINEASLTRNPLFPITLRIDQELLDRIDAAARSRHITRSAWIKNTLSKAVNKT